FIRPFFQFKFLFLFPINRKTVFTRFVYFYFRFKIQYSKILCQFFLIYLNASDSSCIPHFKSNVLPNTGGHQSRTPIPPELILCFPNKGPWSFRRFKRNFFC